MLVQEKNSDVDSVSRSSASRLSARVLVLNSSYEPIHICNVRRAVVLVFKGVAVIQEPAPFALAIGMQGIAYSSFRDPTSPLRTPSV